MKKEGANEGMEHNRALQLHTPQHIEERPAAVAAPASVEDKHVPKVFGRWVKGIFGNRQAEGSLKEALEEVIEEHLEDGEQSISSEERDMLRNMLLMGELSVSDVMIPRTEIVAVEHDITLTELKAVLMEQRHTRMPVYQGTLDRLQGFIHLKDLVPVLAGDEPFDIDTVRRDILFVSPSMKVVDLLVQMRQSGHHMAIVVDEYGGTDGLVTLEDLFEEIVGEIQDEHDDEEVGCELKRLSLSCYESDARMPIEDLERQLKITLRNGNDDGEEDYDTLGGLIYFRLGRIPARGEILNLEDTARLEILEADPRRVRKVKITLRKNVAQEGASSS